MITLKERARIATERLEAVLRLFAPKDTGALSSIGIVRTQLTPGKARITIGNEAVRYAVYTNEPWLHERWRGKKNPNEKWIQRAIENALPDIISVLSGPVTIADLESFQKEASMQYNEQLHALAERYARGGK